MQTVGPWPVHVSHILLLRNACQAKQAYKDIEAVMAAQSDLVEPVARFEPRMVKMAPSGEPPED